MQFYTTADCEDGAEYNRKNAGIITDFNNVYPVQLVYKNFGYFDADSWYAEPVHMPEKALCHVLRWG